MIFFISLKGILNVNARNESANVRTTNSVNFQQKKKVK